MSFLEGGTRVVTGPWSSEHLEWLVKIDTTQTSDGTMVEIWEFRHENDDAMLSAWAKHFRNHYCFDTDIDALRGRMSRKSYLENVKFPSNVTPLGPAVRAGDFGEILIADYLQWVLNFWVPRVRWSSKRVRDESPRGSDVIGFRRYLQASQSATDSLAVFECKTRFSRSSTNGLQQAVDGSAKDPTRLEESLNFIKQRLLERGEQERASVVERFQNPVDHPYNALFGAALLSEEQFLDSQVTSADCTSHSLSLIVIKGADMMALVNDLYRRAAHEA